MAFTYESPASDWVKNRYDWTSVPQLYTGEAGYYCWEPSRAVVDKEQDIIFYQAGGGSGRTSQVHQPSTYLLLWKGIPVRCELRGGTVPATPEISKHEAWVIDVLHMPTRLVEEKDSIIDALREISYVREASIFKDLVMVFDASNVKIVEEI
jgi:hypothetical protein